MHGQDIFISYARDDQGTAQKFAEAFGKEGFSVWWDAALHSGETFDEIIEQELRAAKAVVVLWSPRSVISRWVRAEATLADRNRTLAPVIIEPCNRPIIFELTHTADLCHWDGDVADDHWKVFVKDVRRLVANGRAADAAAGLPPPPPPQPVATRPAPPPLRSAVATAQADGASNVKMDSLLSAVAALQEAIMKQGGTQAAAAIEEPEEEYEATQFYTQSDEFALMGSDELHCLEVSAGDGETKRYIVGPLGIKIGRVAPADVVLADSKVSRSHCTVELKENDLFVSDLNSTNGTYVDGQRVMGAAVLPVGSVLTVGHYTLVHEVRTRAEV
ncbi:TIR domain-containing protein [Altererythrobacter fulvus]|uniref:TIR domain-containing protein n=1 Tax=Caenibius fulvus TaxID=2126012 RepID=UPI003016548D